jgi:hypothetical protein
MAAPENIQNHDVLGLVRRINRFIVELVKSVSSGVSEITGHDRRRLESYLVALRAYKAWVVAQPLLDLPETHPCALPVPAPPEVPELENESVADVLVLLGRLRDELIASQSGRYASTLQEHDSVRFDAIVAKVAAFMRDYVEVATPLDLPESSPATPLTGPGL